MANTLTLGIALEVGWRTFRVFPGAKQAAGWIALLVVVATTSTLIVVPLFAPSFDPFLGAVAQFYPRLANGALWLAAAILGIARWYRVPVHPFHAAVLMGLALSLASGGTLLTLVGIYGYDAFIVDPSILDGGVFLLIACWWLRATWRTEDERTTACDQIVRTLNPRTPPATSSVSAHVDLRSVR